MSRTPSYPVTYLAWRPFSANCSLHHRPHGCCAVRLLRKRRGCAPCVCRRAASREVGHDTDCGPRRCRGSGRGLSDRRHDATAYSLAATDVFSGAAKIPRLELTFRMFERSSVVGISVLHLIPLNRWILLRLRMNEICFML